MILDQINLGLNRLKEVKPNILPPNPETALILGEKALVFDAVLKEEITQEINHTAYPSQVGSFSDEFSFRQPLQLTLEVSHSDHDRGGFDYKIKTIANIGLSLGVVTPETIQNGLKYIYASSDLFDNNLIGSQNTRSARMLQNILNISKSYALFDIQTAKATYKNMAISGIRYANTADTESLLNVTIDFIERKQYGDFDGYDESKMLDNSIDKIRMQTAKKIGNYITGLFS
jgi:hypothetical protein